MTQRARRVFLFLACVTSLTISTVARAASASDEEELPDARLLGYQNPVNVGGGNAGNYILLGILTVLTCGILFKNANRSHLD